MGRHLAKTESAPSDIFASKANNGADVPSAAGGHCAFEKGGISSSISCRCSSVDSQYDQDAFFSESQCEVAKVMSLAEFLSDREGGAAAQGSPRKEIESPDECGPAAPPSHQPRQPASYPSYPSYRSWVRVGKETGDARRYRSLRSGRLVRRGRGATLTWVPVHPRDEEASEIAQSAESTSMLPTPPPSAPAPKASDPTAFDEDEERGYVWVECA